MKLSISILFIVTVIIVGCNSPNNETLGEEQQKVYSIKSNDTTKTVKAKIKFLDNTTYDFGVIKYGSKVNHVFHIKNISDVPLQINNVYSSCGCTVASYPKRPILPQQTDSIEAVFSSSPGTPGMKNKVITILSNAVSSPNLVTILGEVK